MTAATPVPDAGTAAAAPDLDESASSTAADIGDGTAAGPVETGLRAADLTVRAGHRVVVGPVTLSAPTGSATVLVGDPAGGRSTLLAALAGRMRGATGVLELTTAAGVVRGDRALRRRTAVARLAGFVTPEPDVTVATAVDERARLDGVRPAVGRRRFADAVTALAAVLGRDADQLAPLRVAALTGTAATALAVALARVAPADVVLVDDLDAGADDDALTTLLAALGVLAGADEPCVVIGTALRVPVGPHAALLVDLRTPAVPLAPAAGADPGPDTAAHAHLSSDPGTERPTDPDTRTAAPEPRRDADLPRSAS